MANLSAYQTGVSLRLTPAGDFTDRPDASRGPIGASAAPAAPFGIRVQGEIHHVKSRSRVAEPTQRKGGRGKSTSAVPLGSDHDNLLRFHDIAQKLAHKMTLE